MEREREGNKTLCYIHVNNIVTVQTFHLRWPGFV